MYLAELCKSWRARLLAHFDQKPAVEVESATHEATERMRQKYEAMVVKLERTVSGFSKQAGASVRLQKQNTELRRQLAAAEAAEVELGDEVDALREDVQFLNGERSLLKGRLATLEAAVEHALRLASGLPIRALDTGAELRLRADSICVHGDKPSAVAQACGVRDALLAEGFTLCPLPEVVGSRLEGWRER